MKDEHFIMAALTICLIGLVFWIIRKMIDKLDSKVEKLCNDQSRRWLEHDETRSEFVKDFVTDKEHSLICTATQAGIKLHISKTVEDNRKLIQEAVAKGFKDLKKEFKKNGGS